MKKILLVVLAVILALSLVACNNNEELPENNNQVENNNPENNPAEMPDDNGGEETPDENEEVEDLTPSAEMDALIAEIAAGVEVAAPFTQKIAANRSQEYIGITEDVFTANVVDSVAHESMMMPSNHSLCVVKVNADADKDTLANAIFEGCNPRKWICVGADKVLVAYTDEYIMLVMSTEDNCDKLYTAFQNKFGAEVVSPALTKNTSEE